MTQTSTNPPVAPTSPPPQPRRRRSIFGMAFRWLFTLVSLAMLGLIAFLLFAIWNGDHDGLEEKTYSQRVWKGHKHKVAIIRLEGTILTSEGFLKKQIEQVLDDHDVKAVVLRVNSPGGLVAASDGIYHRLVEMKAERKLPIVVSMGGIAASGGYYAAMAVGDTPNSIYAEPTTWTGSIGVIIPHYDFSGLLKEHNVREDSIVSHRLKGMGSLTREMTDEERQILQGLVDDSFTQFKTVVLAGRPNLGAEQLEKLATGQVYTSKQALAQGLVDREGYLEDAIKRAIELAREGDANLKEEDFFAVDYVAPFTLSDLLLAKVKQEAPPLDAAALLDLTVPRAYYLCTWAPGLRPMQPAP